MATIWYPFLYFITHPNPPPWRFLYLRETQGNDLKGLQRFWGGGKDLATISEEEEEEEEQEYWQFGSRFPV